MYDVPRFGNVHFLHFTDCHAQLLPVYFREPSVNLGVGAAVGQPPHLVGEHLLKHFNIARGTPQAHAFTYLDFVQAARTYGKVGGFAHLVYADQADEGKPARRVAARRWRLLAGIRYSAVDQCAGHGRCRTSCWASM